MHPFLKISGIREVTTEKINGGQQEEDECRLNGMITWG
jgi:hypothetical protein